MINRYLLALLFSLSLLPLRAEVDSVFGFREYMAFVYRYHPQITQANLRLDMSDAMLLEARGALDPKIALGQQEKQNDNTSYYDRLSASFKIPTAYGIELGGSLENNQGTYLNPESYTSEKNLYGIGVSIPLLSDVLMSQRRSTIAQARLYQNQTEAEREYIINEILYQASIAYYDWYRYSQEYEIYETYLQNAERRLDGIRRNYEEGDKPAIDTTETRIALQTRALQLEKAKLMMTKARLIASSYLWLEGGVPLTLKEHMRPSITSDEDITSVLETQNTLNYNWEEHPKIQSLDYKKQSLIVEQKLYRASLIPDIRLDYKLLTYEPLQISTYDFSDHYSAISFSMPLLLRKERAKLHQNKIKIQNIDLETSHTTRQIENKVLASQAAIVSYRSQRDMFGTLTSDYQRMLDAELRRFEIGESSVFMVNSRESKLIENLVKSIDIRYQLYTAHSELYRALGRHGMTNTTEESR